MYAARRWGDKAATAYHRRALCSMALCKHTFLRKHTLPLRSGRLCYPAPDVTTPHVLLHWENDVTVDGVLPRCSNRHSLRNAILPRTTTAHAPRTRHMYASGAMRRRIFYPACKLPFPYHNIITSHYILIPPRLLPPVTALSSSAYTYPPHLSHRPYACNAPARVSCLHRLLATYRSNIS